MKFTRTRNNGNSNGGDPAEEEKRPVGETSHGAFSALRLYRQRELDLRRSDHRAIREWQLALVEDLGGQGTVNTFQRSLIDRATELLIIISVMADHVEKNGIMQGNELAPCLRTSFLAYVNSFHHVLNTCFGHGQKQKGKHPKVPSLEDYLRGKTTKEDTQNEGHPGFEERQRNRGDVGSKTTLQIEEEDLIFRYVQITEIGCSQGVAAYDGTGYREDKHISH